MQRTKRYRRYQRQKKIAKRLHILRSREDNYTRRFYREYGKIPWYEETPGKLDKFNLTCSCWMCKDLKKSNSSERTPHREKRKYGSKEEAGHSKG